MCVCVRVRVPCQRACSSGLKALLLFAYWWSCVTVCSNCRLPLALDYPPLLPHHPLPPLLPPPSLPVCQDPNLCRFLTPDIIGCRTTIAFLLGTADPWTFNSSLHWLFGRMEDYHKPDQQTLQALRNIATRLRINSIKATTAAGSG